ncbi:DeoR/GlpR transcriptional regulator [Alicyclobacillaceae bacterium I2511]|nr:DeoR/GlpR transcriptional regulator [Alicyclobacillaceae bacterium I2511]
MLTTTRRKLIVQKVESQGQVTLAELSSEFGVSGITIRRDLDVLERDGVLVRVRGGAILPDNWEIHSYQAKESVHLELKDAISDLVAMMVRPNTSIFLDTGSTMLGIARKLLERNTGPLTICTNDIKVALELGEHQNFSVISLGGELRAHVYYVAGHFAEKMVHDLRADIAFIGCDSVSLRFGAMTSSRELIPLKKAMMASSRRSVLVCDSSKFGRMSSAAIASVVEFDVLITDDQLSDTEVELLTKAGIDFKMATTTLDEQQIDGEEIP